MVSTTSLYIIGNGFDICHGIRSRFSDFKQYLAIVDSSLLSDVEEYLPVKEDWSDLEASFANLDTDYIGENLSCFLPSYGSDDWSDSGHHDYEYEVKKLITNLSEVLKANFLEWVLQLDVTKEQLFNLPASAKYLTFNYTPILQTVYGLPDKNILHIHNKADDKLSDLILGHAWNPSEIVSLNHRIDGETCDVRIYGANAIIDEYFGKTFKHSQKIIKENADFFSSLHDITHIYVMGHSLSGIDIDYFRALVDSIDTDTVRWKISYYLPEQLITHRNTMKILDVPEALFEITKLENF